MADFSLVPRPLPRFQCARVTLKTWEWPGDEATMALHRFMDISAVLERERDRTNTEYSTGTGPSRLHYRNRIVNFWVCTVYVGLAQARYKPLNLCYE